MVLLISLLQFISLCGPLKQNANSFTFQLFDSQDQHVCSWKSSRFPLVSRFDFGRKCCMRIHMQQASLVTPCINEISRVFFTNHDIHDTLHLGRSLITDSAKISCATQRQKGSLVVKKHSVNVIFLQIPFLKLT